MKTLGKTLLILVGVLALAWFAIAGRYLVQPFWILAAAAIFGLVALMRYQQRKNPYEFYRAMRAWGKLAFIATILGGIVMVMGLGAAGAVLALPLVGLGYWLFRVADGKSEANSKVFRPTKEQQDRLDMLDTQERDSKRAMRDRKEADTRQDAEIRAKLEKELADIHASQQ